jgi:hypothetical protein
MASSTAHSGEFKYQQERFKFRVVSLEFIRGKRLDIEAICFAPNLTYPNNKEHIFKYSTTAFNVQDEQLKVALTIINAVVKKAKLNKGTLHKLTIKNDNIFWLVEVKK